MKRLLYCLTIIFGLALQSATAAKPNILFIMVDDLGKDWISCYGADEIDTPNIDRLAKGGPKVLQRLVDAAVHAHPRHAAHRPIPPAHRLGESLGRSPLGCRLLRLGKLHHLRQCDEERRLLHRDRRQVADQRLSARAGGASKHGFDDWAVWTGYETGIRRAASAIGMPTFTPVLAAKPTRTNSARIFIATFSSTT
ncbi:MAG: hypothetical protein Ct9H300mP32_6910 [Verrucomicrobiota bacterium]|nr:MAG: hypothetical protein Ct9H300mP32_6910 [Verrucomicrobiota bacterium]